MLKIVPNKGTTQWPDVLINYITSFKIYIFRSNQWSRSWKYWETNKHVVGFWSFSWDLSVKPSCLSRSRLFKESFWYFLLNSKMIPVIICYFLEDNTQLFLSWPFHGQFSLSLSTMSSCLSSGLFYTDWIDLHSDSKRHWACLFMDLGLMIPS